VLSIPHFTRSACWLILLIEMKDDNTDHYEGALLEEVNQKIDRLAEALADVPTKLTSIDGRLSGVEDELKVIRAAVIDQSRELHDHESRIMRLESTT
jgi:septal ring factor EnvC (AmiA/AmiB activator)